MTDITEKIFNLKYQIKQECKKIKEYEKLIEKAKKRIDEYQREMFIWGDKRYDNNSN